MGEVYRGIDTRLQRPVSIKRAQGPFTERFHGEARAISALNHPHVCTLYDVGEDYLVMELVEGETLASRLVKGPLPVAEVLRLGSQMADALATAHARGIVHRDLKPANVMLTRAGVKLLDFGLAKVIGSLVDTAPVTQGVIGTLPYMAPEQLAGTSADQRTDIYALGLVLHEMVTGRRVLVGQGEAPALDGVPERLAHVIERCLAREPEDRWQSVGDVRRELEWAARSTSPRGALEPAPLRRRSTGVVVTAALCVIAALAGAFAARRFGGASTPSSDAEVRTTIVLPAGLHLDSFVPLALSPDGTRLAFVAIDEKGTRQLYLRPLGTAEVKALPGTTGARRPFFSPDGRSIAFFADDALQRIDVDGGSPLRVCPLPGLDSGGAWGADDTIVVAIRGRGLFKVSAMGGTLERIDQVPAARNPSFLPDGRTVLYASIPPEGPALSTGFSVVSLDGTGLRQVARLSDADGTGAPVLGASAEVSQATMLPSGHLVFGQDPGFVRAMLLDPQTLRPSGPTVTLGESVERGAGAGGIAFAASSSGLLVFAGTGTDHELVWVTRQGAVTPLPTDKGAYRNPRLSPDGKTIVVSANDATRTPQAWLIDVARGARTRLAIEAIQPAWAPDGLRIAFGAGIGVAAAVVGAPLKTLVPLSTIREKIASGTDLYPTDWSSDGRYLLFQANTQQVWRLAVPDGRLEQVLDGPGDEWATDVAQDLRAVAYVSTQSGRPEVYVAAWPALDRQRAVSTQGAASPRWSRDSRELFYWQNQTLMAATVDAALGVSEPRPLFSGAFVGAAGSTAFDVASDGRFLMVKSDPRAELREITVVQHWGAASAGQ